jgi:hypothetical protein
MAESLQNEATLQADVIAINPEAFYYKRLQRTAWQTKPISSYIREQGKSGRIEHVIVGDVNLHHGGALCKL